MCELDMNMANEMIIFGHLWSILNRAIFSILIQLTDQIKFFQNLVFVIVIVLPSFLKPETVNKQLHKSRVRRVRGPLARPPFGLSSRQ
jgi:hypothetical protein